MTAHSSATLAHATGVTVTFTFAGTGLVGLDSLGRTWRIPGRTVAAHGGFRAAVIRWAKYRRVVSATVAEVVIF